MDWEVLHVFSKIITMEQHILEQERVHPEATGTFTNLLYDIALAAKIISREIRRAGLGNILGEAGTVNVQGEEQMRLDVFANETFIRMNSYTGRVALWQPRSLRASSALYLITPPWQKANMCSSSTLWMALPTLPQM